jgi:hypothetical protein
MREVLSAVRRGDNPGVPQMCRSDQGDYDNGGSGLSRARVPPNHCHNCGTAFPWTTGKIAAAKEYAAELEGLDETEKARLASAIDDLATDGPRTELTANRFKTLMSKAGQALGSGIYKIVLDVATEAAKKVIMG